MVIIWHHVCRVCDDWDPRDDSDPHDDLDPRNDLNQQKNSNACDGNVLIPVLCLNSGKDEEEINKNQERGRGVQEVIER